MFVPFFFIALATVLAGASSRPTLRLVGALSLGTATALFLNLALHSQGPLYFKPSFQNFALVELVFVVDFLSLSFASLVCFTATLLLAYGEFNAETRFARSFTTLLHLLTFALLAAVFSENIFSFYCASEIAVLLFFFLLTFDAERGTRNGQIARRSVLIASAGGVSLILGLILTNFLAGASNFHELHLPISHVYLRPTVIFC